MISRRQSRTINQRLSTLGLYDGRYLWELSLSDQDNRTHDLLDEIETLRETLDRLRATLDQGLALAGLRPTEEQRRINRLTAEADSE